MIAPSTRLPLLAIVISVVSLVLATIISLGLTDVVAQRFDSHSSSINERLLGWAARIQKVENSTGAIVSETRSVRNDLEALSDRMLPEPVAAQEQPAAPTKPAAAPKPVAKPAPPVLPQAISDPDGGLLETAGLRLALEVLGFSFKSAGPRKVVGQYLSTIATLHGDPHVTEALVIGIAVRDNNDANFAILATMAAVASASTSWGSQWITDSLQQLISTSNNNAGRRATLSRSGGGVRLTLAVATTAGEYHLTVGPS